MKALKYFYALCLCIHLQAAHDPIDLELRRGSFPYYEVNDIFGVAQLVKQLLSNSDELKKLLADPMSILRATVVVGGIAAIVKVSLASVEGLGARLPDQLYRLWKSSISRIKRFFNIAEGFDPDELIIWSQLFEQIIAVGCEDEQFIDKDQLLVSSTHWDYQRYFVNDMLRYLLAYMETHKQYYRSQQIKYEQHMRAHICDPRVNHVCFLVQSIINSLVHLIAVHEQALTIAEFDSEHVKRVSRNVVIVFKKLCVIINGDVGQDAGQTDFAFSASSSGLGLFDV
jgi:hypothetical protein